ncbi:PDR/VanB family oxidoreductase [Glaciimonas immobilis]|uniref:Vanillate O-demethylase ferredoxin subunit n=1 Tax=Glaciimonas immobilis TaxID=728004 RepID=A0A840RTQ0_9BURK|nr:PDR/VanB family oxidoreductase [Glaciimonas immobilis]KAF3999821.1 oxidoreductase [Glaciimonas immobilis]MBB5200296.1 vanillate O-demethylase ferredoxin subunit [Glaciimonas immobilis]
MESTPTQPRSTPATLSLLIRQIRSEASGINSFELVHPAGEPLPAVAAGAHIDLYLDGGVIRQYSLCNDPVERHRYVIAVLREDAGQGGSRLMHDNVRVRDIVSVSYPRNNFGLVPGAKKHILLAGGIGVTPLKAMAHYLESTGEDYALHYCAKSEEHAAFREEFAVQVAKGRVIFHFDGGNPRDGLDLVSLLESHVEGTHVYYCGPGGFMAACATATQHWPRELVHFEHFKAPVQAAPTISATVAVSAEISFLKIASSGALFAMSEDKSIVEVLAENGIDIETSCQSGLCGTCKTRYLEGEVDHRDYILSDEDHLEYLTACVSRPKGKLLVLDL